MIQARKHSSDDPFSALFKQAANNRKRKTFTRSNRQRNNNRNHSALAAKNKTNKQVLCNQGLWEFWSNKCN